jgi:formylglycine-generating enzyme required for sulfatase activity
MKFVPVPGTGVLFSIWETRVKDYAAFAAATAREVDKGYFPQTDEDPVIHVSFADAEAFCAWLSSKENRKYRLPKDIEWSAAIGLKEKPFATPSEAPYEVSYPWGSVWPPPEGSGNFGDASTAEVMETSVIPGYKDGFPYTSPVGRFAPNVLGIFDLAGNVSEWCEDWYDMEKKKRVYRGASWVTDTPGVLRSGFRMAKPPEETVATLGFRCVIAIQSKDQ